MRTVRLPAALAALLLLAALAAGCVRVVLPRVDDGDAWWDDPGADAAAGGGSVPADGVREIRIDWVAGAVDVRTGDGEEIVIAETADGALRADEQLRFTVEDGVLHVVYCRPGLHTMRQGGKTLSVTVPAALSGALDALAVHTVSAAARVDGLSGGALTWDTVSGQLSQTGGRFARVEAQSVSGVVSLAPAALPEEVSCAAVSGNLALTLPGGDAGFALELQSVSGGLDCAVPVTVQGKRYVYGDGACRIDCNMVSGGVEVRLPDA